MKVLVKGYDKPWLDGQPNCTDDGDYITIEIELDQASLLDFLASAIDVVRKPYLQGFGFKLEAADLKVYREGSELSGKGLIKMTVKEDE